MLVEDLSISTTQADPGKFSVRSENDPRYVRHDDRGRKIDPAVVGGWAVVDGKVPNGFLTLSEYQQGIVVRGTQKRIQYREYRNEQDQVNDINWRGVTLREVIADREDAVEKDRLETKFSNQRLADMERGFETGADHGRVHRQDFEFLNKPVEDQEVAPKNKGGRPRKIPQD